MADPLLDLEMRRRIVALVEQYPGLHARELARQLAADQALVEYHLPLLVEAGLLLQERDRRYKRLYPRHKGRPVPASKKERAMLAALREDHALRIVLLLLDRGPLPHKHIAEPLGMGKSLLSYHLGKLAAVGLVERTADGAFAVTDPREAHALLLRHRPTKDVLGRFMDLWGALYGA